MLTILAVAKGVELGNEPMGAGVSSRFRNVHWSDAAVADP